MKKVLVIDDGNDFCEMLKFFLVKKKHIVHTALKLETGLKMLKELQPDALILDNNLPDGFGWLYVEEILHHHPGIQITLVSAQPLDSLFKSKIGQSVNFLQKPISLDQIENLL